MFNQNKVWEIILNFARSNKGKTLSLLNHAKGSPFIITEASENYVRVDKLQIKMTKQMFLGIYEYLKSRRDWLKIGASRVGTSPETIEGFIKSKFFKGKIGRTKHSHVVRCHSCLLKYRSRVQP